MTDVREHNPTPVIASDQNKQFYAHLTAWSHPEWYSDEFGRLLQQAGLRRIRLHDSRHTTLSLMEKAGVPTSIISKWAGHYDSAFTYRTYVHARDEDLK